MERRLLNVILMILQTGIALAQSSNCNNIGFEDGNFNGWSLSYGTVTHANQKIIFNNETPGTNNNQHTIMNASSGNDPFITAEAIPVVAPGSNYSIRIGNLVPGPNFARIKTTFRVTTENDLFQYKFAVVLQNTSEQRQIHAPYEKPGFNLQIYDSDGNTLACSYYDIQLQDQGIVNGFKSQGELQYRNWTTGAVDLRNYIGKDITVVVTAHDCTGRAHFGYAYFDAQCSKSELNTVSSCPDPDGKLTLAAPAGFGSYLWDTGEKTQTIRVEAVVGDSYNVALTPLASLDSSCVFLNNYKIQFKKSEVTLNKFICEGDEFSVGNQTYRTSGTYVNTIAKSSVCDSTVTLHLTVRTIAHFEQSLVICEGEKVRVGDTTYTTSGHYVKTINRGAYCDSIVTTNLFVDHFKFNLSDHVTMTEGDSVQLQGYPAPEGDYIYQWGSIPGLSCYDCPNPWAKPLKTSTYSINVTNDYQACRESGKVNIRVVPCGITAPDAFSPNHNGQNDVFYIIGNSCVSKVRSFAIFNRWGEVIFQKSNFQASDPAFGWDGTYKGVPQGSGVYTYRVTFDQRDGKINASAGSVMLLK